MISILKRPFENLSPKLNLFIIKPYSQRLFEYKQTKRKIFGDELQKKAIDSFQELPDPYIRMSRSTTRIKFFWKDIKFSKKFMLSSIVNVDNDIRSYAEVQIFGQTHIGLLDSGATASCIGGDLAKQVIADNIPYSKIKSNVYTASGAKQSVLGNISCLVTFKGVNKLLDLLLVPSLTQNLYFGINFWKLFSLAPNIIGELNDSGSNEPTQHPKLNSDQNDRLLSTVKLFPSFSKLGLGKTNILAHEIDVGENRPIKQRHYPVSPAIEKLMYAELDRMLQLGVIEPSNSAFTCGVDP